MDHSLCVIYPVPGSPPAEGTDVARMEQTAEEACHGGRAPSCTGTRSGVLAQQLDEFWGRISSCHLQSGGVGSAQQSSSQMPQGWAAPCKLMLFHLMGEAELSSICPRLGECPPPLLSLLAGGCPPVTNIPALPQGSLPAAARGEPCRTQQHTIKPQLILPCFCRGLKVTQMKQLSIKAGCCVNMH